MIFERFFARRHDGRAILPPDIAQLERDLEERLALRRAAREEHNPHKRAHLTRAINRSAGK